MVMKKGVGKSTSSTSVEAGTRPCTHCGQPFSLRGVVTHEQYCHARPGWGRSPEAVRELSLVEDTFRRVRVMDQGEVMAEITVPIKKAS